MKDRLLSILSPKQVYMQIQEPHLTNAAWRRSGSVGNRATYRYYLGYEVDGRSFLHQINQNDLARYGDLSVTQMERLNTQRCDFKELVSVQFVCKVLEQLETGNYSYPVDDPRQKIA